jgi:acyl-CoA thioester hydrolase
MVAPTVELESTTVVRFQDCDPFGHLNNARYIDYFLNARQDQIAASYGLALYEPGKPPAESWVVSQTQIAYLAPAQMAEEILIRTRLIEYNESRLVVEGVMLDRDERRIRAVAWMDFTYVSLLTGRRTGHPEHLMALFQQVEADGIFAEDGFNRRVAELRGEHRPQRGEQRTQRGEHSSQRGEHGAPVHTQT